MPIHFYAKRIEKNINREIGAKIDNTATEANLGQNLDVLGAITRLNFWKTKNKLIICGVELTKLTFPNLPRANLPRADVPRADVPSANLPRANLPQGN